MGYKEMMNEKLKIPYSLLFPTPHNSAPGSLTFAPLVPLPLLMGLSPPFTTLRSSGSTSDVEFELAFSEDVSFILGEYREAVSERVSAASCSIRLSRSAHVGTS